jgi:3'-phosphoadenosine 5'-phosphosulfate sulfotransferase (PAPS reductase)/FAD synthetase
MADYSIDKNIQGLIDRGALFVANHSGGKDSQAMLLKLRNCVPRTQLIVIHADLPDIDWPGTWEHIENTCADLKPIKVVAVKTFFEMVERRQMWPSPKYRQCTSDLKRGPIEKAIRHHIKDHDLSGLVVNCMGIRAEESCMRAKAKVFQFSRRNSKAGREWYDWLPIHEWTTDEVYAEILAANECVHWAYHMGMDRLSCIFCIMASKDDLVTAAKLEPEVYSRMVQIEKDINFSFVMPKKNQKPVFLEDITGLRAN